jgi:hypothetical protein
MKKYPLFPLLLIGFMILFGVMYTIAYPHSVGKNPRYDIRDNEPVDQFELDEALLPYWESFQADAKSHGFNYDRIYSIKKITLRNPNSRDFYHLQGLTLFDYKVIYLNEKLLKDTVGLKLVFYHELGHWFGLEHSDNIMTTKYDTKVNSNFAKENWTELVDNYFAKLKANEN